MEATTSWLSAYDLSAVSLTKRKKRKEKKKKESSCFSFLPPPLSTLLGTESHFNNFDQYNLDGNSATTAIKKKSEGKPKDM